MKQGRFLWLSDVHLDPLYGTNQAVTRKSNSGSNATQLCLVHADNRDETTAGFVAGQVGCDTPPSLFQNLLQHAASATTTTSTTTSSGLDFIILTGDLCRHGQENLTTISTLSILQNVSSALSETFHTANKNISIIPSLGNNDLTMDYYLDIHNATESLNMITNGLQALWESETEQMTFRQGGYFARNVSEHLTVVSLNTVVYSTEHQPSSSDDNDEVPTDDDDPLYQFDWLTQQLAIAQTAQRYVYIIGHIPPAMGSYRHSQLWNAAYAKRYYAILERYHDIIQGQFFGHIHTDEFRLIPSITSTSRSSSSRSSSPWPLWMAPSVTPIYGSNPSYRIVSYDTQTGALLDYETFYLDLEARDNLISNNNNTNTTMNVWTQGPSFQESFHVSDMSVSSLQTLIQKLNQSITNDDEDVNMQENSLWEALITRQHVYLFDGNKNDTTCQDLDCRKDWICTLTTFTKDDYQNTCLGQDLQLSSSSFDSRKQKIWGIVIGVGVVIVIGLFSWRFFCRNKTIRRRRQYRQPGDGGGLNDQLQQQPESRNEEERVEPLPRVTRPGIV